MKQERKTRATKKTWQSLTTNIVGEIEQVELKIRDILKESEQRIKKTKKTVDWDWDYMIEMVQPTAIYWDNATEEDITMLDYATKFNHTWREVSKKLHQARQLLVEAHEDLNKLR